MVWCLQFKLVFDGKPIGNNVYIFGFPAFIERKRKKERKGGREGGKEGGRKGGEGSKRKKKNRLK